MVDRAGATALHAAVSAVWVNGVRALLDALAEEEEGAGDGSEEAAAAAAVVNARDVRGWTPLHAAISRLPTPSALPSPTTSHTAADVVTICSLLLAHGAHPSTPTHAGDAPLHLAALRGSRALCALLLQAGADRLAENRDGMTASDVAASSVMHWAVAADEGRGSAADKANAIRLLGLLCRPDSAATTLQSLYRRRCASKEAAARRRRLWACVRMQAGLRGWVGRVRWARRLRAWREGELARRVVLVQAAARCVLVFRISPLSLFPCLIISHSHPGPAPPPPFLRRFLSLKIHRPRLHELQRRRIMEAAAVSIQRRWRGWLGRAATMVRRRVLPCWKFVWAQRWLGVHGPYPSPSYPLLTLCCSLRLFPLPSSLFSPPSSLFSLPLPARPGPPGGPCSQTRRLVSRR